MYQHASLFCVLCLAELFLSALVTYGSKYLVTKDAGFNASAPVFICHLEIKIDFDLYIFWAI